MDNNDDFSALNYPIEVIDNGSDQSSVTDGKRKRKRSTLLTEYLCKRRGMRFRMKRKNYQKRNHMLESIKMNLQNLAKIHLRMMLKLEGRKGM